MLIICIIPECITEPIEKHLFKNFVFFPWSIYLFQFTSNNRPGPYQSRIWAVQIKYSPDTLEAR